MSQSSEKQKFLRAIRKCLSDTHGHFQQAMDALDEIGRGSVAVGVTPIIGGYAMKDPKENYRTALISLDSAEKALEPLARRLRDGRVDGSYFKEARAMTLLVDLVDFDYNILITLLSERRGRESVWYRLDELSKTAKAIFDLVAEE